MHVGADGRTAWARRFRDLVTGFANDLGGAEALPAMKMALVRRAASLAIEAERLEASLANGQQVDIDLLARLASHQRRIVEQLGLDKVKPAAGPTAASIAAEIRARRDA